MKRSYEMTILRSEGYVIVHSMDKVVDLQDESIVEGIVIDYLPVLVVDSPRKAFKVFQVGGGN